MRRITYYTATVAVVAAFTLSAVAASARTAAAARWDRVRQDPERGDVPGWAIASGAATALALIVYAAYSGVISKWVGKIN